MVACVIQRNPCAIQRNPEIIHTAVVHALSRCAAQRPPCPPGRARPSKWHSLMVPPSAACSSSRTAESRPSVPSSSSFSRRCPCCCGCFGCRWSVRGAARRSAPPAPLGARDPANGTASWYPPRPLLPLELLPLELLPLLQADAADADAAVAGCDPPV